MLGLNRLHLAGAVVALMLAACSQQETTITCPPPGNVCYDKDGNTVDHNGNPVDANGNPIVGGDGSGGGGDGTGGGGDGTGGGDDGTGGGGDGTGGGGVVEPNEHDVCWCTITPGVDSDGDCITDAIELATGTDPNDVDTDKDLVRDGCEDHNHDGIRQSTEWDPRNPDTDGDCIIDGLEDKDHNGHFALALHETSPILLDSDRDGVDDGVEDRNCNGQVDGWQDKNGNGCFDSTPDHREDGESDPALADTDGDFIGDGREDANHNGFCDPEENSCAFLVDTDCDRLPDGSEDTNRNGVFNTGETNPRLADTDGDGILDGIEDANLNGVYEPATETDPRNVDSDGDTIQDGVEDANHNGIVDGPVFDGAGCWNGAHAETDPRKKDSDGDGILDNIEDKNKNGICDVADVVDPNAPGGVRHNALVESCAFLTDSDCDGIPDGREDKNLNGTWELSETDAKYNDTDRDGLIDGCPPAFDFTHCEDRNNNGNVDPGETDPRSVDTDLDGLTDRCEVQFSPVLCTTASCITNPLSEDTDGDGKFDGEEDANHNCVFEPERGETDPRKYDAGAAVGSAEYPKSQVCDAENLKQLTFAASADPALDYQLAFEVEKSAAGAEATYFKQAFGIELSNPNNVVLEDSPNDMVWGHIFESPAGVVVDSATNAAVNRNVYGFVLAREAPPATQLTQSDLEKALDDIRDSLPSLFTTSGAVVEISNVPSRPAHDDHPGTSDVDKYRVFRAQREYRIAASAGASGAVSGIWVRSRIMQDIFGLDKTEVAPDTVLNDTVNDPVYGAVSCPNNKQCYQNFTMYIGAVQRPQQPGPNSVGVTLFIVAITPDDSTASTTSAATRLYKERLTRLEDLTGGSALARYAARRSNACEDRNATPARADMLFVVDDSASMQAMVGKLQQAARDAQAVLTANANNVNFRVGMTTTNPSRFGRTFCPSASDPGQSSATSFSPSIGCMGYCNDPASCAGLRATEASATDPQHPNQFIYQLPGGGGTFYYEDTAWMDCHASTDNNYATTVHACNTVPGFEPFFTSGNRTRLVGNAGFLGSNTDDTRCANLAPVGLAYDASSASGTCMRLLNECSDGPTVLGSQMCDLIRAMGGYPEISSGAGGARPNSQNETGLRSARRLLTTLASQHAFPLDKMPATGSQNYLRLNCRTDAAADDGSPIPCDDDSDCGQFDVCATDHQVSGSSKVGTCEPTGNCMECDPRAGTTMLLNSGLSSDPIAAIPGHTGHTTCSTDSDCGRGERCFGSGASKSCVVNCSPVPVVTVVISDEEDYLFKDECASAHTVLPAPGVNWQHDAENTTDEAQLYTDCYFNPATKEVDANGLPLPKPCIDMTQTNPLLYCQQFAPPTGSAGLATGYNPDVIPAIGGVYPRPDSSQVMQWRDDTAPECLSFNPPNPGSLSNLATPTGTSCLDDPCRVIPDQTACTNSTNGNYCRWAPNAEQAGGRCVNYCEFITANAADNTPNGRLQQRASCEANPACYFDTGFGRDGIFNSTVPSMVANQKYACQPRIPLNDCQACKRAIRRYGSVIGTRDTKDDAACGVHVTQAACSADPLPCEWRGSSCVGADLIGLGDVGPVYAIVRERGKPGFLDERSGAPDQCNGGPKTWGRGDGQAYRDVAVDTLGRAQNVCASNYQDFMQLLVTDIVALSAPYKFSESPIAATIKVGIGRLQGDGHTWDYFEVPRSNTQGFVYDPTSNSIGFKSDPIDSNGNGQIDQSEIEAARNSPQVPRAKDLVFISYRFWRSVPCVDGCPVGETCMRTACPTAATSCTTATMAQDCPGGVSCDSNHQCVYACTDDGYLERCVPNPCGECQSLNPSTGKCDSISSATNQCGCFQEGSGINCNPYVPNTCPSGLSCDESCVCLPPNNDCKAGFNLDGSVKDCAKALACCQDPTVECCAPGETPICYQPVEDPSRSVFGCQGGQCSCTTAQSCTTDNDCLPNNDGFGNGAVKCLHGVCDCNPVTQSCLPDAGGGCACKQTPG